jgi:hypothetical protein
MTLPTRSTANAPTAATSPPSGGRGFATGTWWIESGLRGATLRRSARRDSQVWSTARRSGRRSIGIRRFESCSLHSPARQRSRAANAGARFEPREAHRVCRRFESCSLHSVLPTRYDREQRGRSTLNTVHLEQSVGHVLDSRAVRGSSESSGRDGPARVRSTDTTGGHYE